MSPTVGRAAVIPVIRLLGGSKWSRSRRARTPTTSTTSEPAPTITSTDVEAVSSAGSAQAPGDSQHHYAAAITAELTREYQRREQLYTRAAAVITSSTAISAALVSLAVLVRGTSTALASWTTTGVAGSALLLVSAWVLSILVALPNASARMKQESLREMVTQRWGDPAAEAEQALASAQVAVLEVLRTSNDHRTRVLGWALWLQAGAVIVLAASLAGGLLAGTPA